MQHEPDIPQGGAHRSTHRGERPAGLGLRGDGKSRTAFDSDAEAFIRVVAFDGEAALGIGGQQGL